MKKRISRCTVSIVFILCFLGLRWGLTWTNATWADVLAQ